MKLIKLIFLRADKARPASLSFYSSKQRQSAGIYWFWEAFILSTRPRKQRIFESSVSDLPKHLSSDHLKRVVRAYNAIYEVDELVTGLFTDVREYQKTEEDLKIEGYGLLRRKQERLWSIVMQMNENTVVTLHDLPKNFDATFPASWVIDRS